MKLSEKIINHLAYAKAFDGRVGSKVSATGTNSNNCAWIYIIAKKVYDVSGESNFICYEVAYSEFKETYNEEEHGLDYDLFLVREEFFYNIESIEGVEAILTKWMNDFSCIEPIVNVGHPMY